jgi:hypothetical protein
MNDNWTHIVIDSENNAAALVDPGGANLSVSSGTSAIARATINSWIATYGDLDGVCTQFGWTNQTGSNYDNS